MELISCTHCGVVLDKDRIIQPRMFKEDQVTRIEESSTWDGHKYVPVVRCPVCELRIEYETGDEVYD